MIPIRYSSISVAVSLGVLLMSGCARFAAQESIPPVPVPHSAVRDYAGVKIRYRNLTQSWVWTHTEQGDLARPRVAANTAKEADDDTVIEAVARSVFAPDERIVVPFGFRSRTLAGRGQADLDDVVEASTATTRYRLQGGVGLRSLRGRELARARTAAVHAYLVSKGVHAERIDVAEYDPAVPGLRVEMAVDWE